MNYFYYNTDARSLDEEPLPRFPVLIEGGFAAVGGDREKYGERLDQLRPGDLLLMYENGIGVVAMGRVRERWDGVSHEIPRYYKPVELNNNLDGAPYEYRIAVDWFLDLTASPISIGQMRQLFGYKQRATVTRGAIQIILRQREAVARLVEEAQTLLLPGEITRPKTYLEGATRRVFVNAYERNLEAVLECKARFGSKCLICDFDFGAVYGAELSGFIHVHHLRPLSEIREEYAVDPEKDLRPVCPNCHAVIHHRGGLKSVEEVKELIARQKRG